MSSLIEGDVEKKEKILKLLTRIGPFVSILSYLAGIVYFGFLPHEMLIHGTYISENALLPGLVNSDIRSSEQLFNYYEKLKSNYESKKELDLDFVKSLFSSKAEAYFQSFNVSNPFLKGFRDFNAELHSKKARNLYALSRTRRADGTESIVITAPLYLTRDRQSPNLMGISMMLVMAEIAKTKPYWAKDLIFVVPELNDIGMQAWINSYYDIKSEYISGENLNCRGGSIQAALNLEFGGDPALIDKIEVKLEGPNGKLPNLDLFNTVIRVCKSVAFECSLDSERGTSWSSDNTDYNMYGGNRQSRPRLDHLKGLENTVAMLFRQATGAPASLHGYFLNHRIEALTLKGAKSFRSGAKRSSPKKTLLDAVQVVEGTMRSVNNLLERFHQSFFFYLLPSSHYYISIGMYMPAFGLVALPLLIQILMIWFSIFYKKSSQDPNKIETSSFLFNLFRIVLAKVFIAASFGLLLYFGTPYFVYFGKKIQLNPKDSIVNSYIAIIVNIFASPILVDFKMRSENESQKDYLTETSENLLKLFAILQLTIFLGTLSLLNFSFAFLIALFYVPASILAIQSFQNKILRFFQMIVWLLATPIVYFLILYFVHGYLFENFELSRLRGVFDSALDSFYNLVLMNKISNIWTYDLVNLCLVPIWTLIWFITFPKLK